MNEIGTQLLSKLLSSLPGASVYWEKEPVAHDFNGAVLTAEYNHKKFTMQFQRDAEKPVAEPLDASFVEQVVDDFAHFFSRSIYPKEKFTRII